jgi:hypothetical protein
MSAMSTLTTAESGASSPVLASYAAGHHMSFTEKRVPLGRRLIGWQYYLMAPNSCICWILPRAVIHKRPQQCASGTAGKDTQCRLL